MVTPLYLVAPCVPQVCFPFLLRHDFIWSCSSKIGLPSKLGSPFLTCLGNRPAIGVVCCYVPPHLSRPYANRRARELFFLPPFARLLFSLPPTMALHGLSRRRTNEGTSPSLLISSRHRLLLRPLGLLPLYPLPSPHAPRSIPLIHPLTSRHVVTARAHPSRDVPLQGSFSKKNSFFCHIPCYPMIEIYLLFIIARRIYLRSIRNSS